MWQALAVGTDFVHAALMALWFAGLPLLFWRRWRRVASLYAVYAIAFVAVSQLSRWMLGECFLTSIARQFWQRVPESGPVSQDWFTVRFAQMVFHTAPSHRAIALVSEAMILVAAAAAFRSLHHLHVGRRAQSVRANRVVGRQFTKATISDRTRPSPPDSTSEW